VHFIRSTSWKAKQGTAGSSSTRKGEFGVRLVELTCNSFPPALLKSLGVTNVGEEFKEKGRAVPIDFDGNWPEMNLRPTAAFLPSVVTAIRYNQNLL
jgi:hypothetical protein